MEEYVGLSSDELRSPLGEERSKYAEKQKALLEAKSKINRGKLSSVSSATEKSLNVFLRSCCEETEKEQVYVSTVIKRVRATADHTRNNLEKVNQHAKKLLKNVESDVVELSDNLRRVKSGHTTLSTTLKRRESKGSVLRERRDDTLRSSAIQFDKAGKVFCKIESRIDSQIAHFESTVLEYERVSTVIDAELCTLEEETEQAESVLMVHQEDEVEIQDQFRKTSAEYNQLQTQLTNRNKAKECAESDQTRIEMEVTELRDTTQKMTVLVSAKIDSLEEDKSQISKLAASIAELNDVILPTEADVQQFEQSLIDQQEAVKITSDDLVHTLELEVESICNQLSTDTVRADVMDNVFGSNIDFTPEMWKASIENAKTLDISNKELVDCRDSLLLELGIAKSELEKVLQDAKIALTEQNDAQSRKRNLEKRIQEDQESRDSNAKMMEARIAQAMKELEELTNSKCSEAANDALVEPDGAVVEPDDAVVEPNDALVEPDGAVVEPDDAVVEPNDAVVGPCDAVVGPSDAVVGPSDAFVTPNPARHSSLQSLRKASVEASRGISDDSDTESVKKSVIDLPDGIVKRNAATQQCSIVRSPDVSTNQLDGEPAAIGGTSTETTAVTNALGNDDGDVTMEGIPLSASIDQAFNDDKVENWIRTTPENISPGSGTTAEMMDDRFPKNLFNETNALNETDITMDMGEDDLNLSMMEMPAATANKTLSPPPVRQSSSKASIFMNDSDSDANASVWDDDF